MRQVTLDHHYHAKVASICLVIGPSGAANLWFDISRLEQEFYAIKDFSYTFI
jgi:hypothetical protein